MELAKPNKGSSVTTSSREHYIVDRYSLRQASELNVVTFSDDARRSEQPRDDARIDDDDVRQKLLVAPASAPIQVDLKNCS